MLRIYIMCCFVLFCGLVFGQTDNWMATPVKHKVSLAGTFGELRTNHFHTGVDIKSSNGKIGDPIYAVADGYIRRVKISASGYGNALYIDHPNGMTTVYAHLYRFGDDVSEFMEEVQYSLETFEVDTTLTNEVFVIKQGQQIGVMGSTGRSFGPHLHFEIRETKTEIPINPLTQGMIISDDVAPKVEYLQLNVLDDKRHKKASKKVPLVKTGNIYKPAEKLVSVPAWRVGVAVFVRDLMTGIWNKNGIYKGELYVDSMLVFSFQMDSISFDEFRYLNAHIDYDHYKKTKHRIHQFYRKKGNGAHIYNENDDQIIKLYAEKPRNVEVILSDFHGNKSIIQCQLIRDTNMQAYKGYDFQYFLEQGEDHIINRDDVKIKFDAKNFYEDVYLSIHSIEEKEDNYQSSVYHVGDKNIAIHGSYDIYLRHNLVDSLLTKKAVIALCENNKYKSYGGHSLDGLIGTKVSSFGPYVVMIDTIAPTIKPISVPVEVRNLSKITFSIDDNMNVAGKAEDLKYNAWVDGQWILMKYDLKTKTISHTVTDKWLVGSYRLTLEVEDDRGNKSSWKREVRKK